MAEAESDTTGSTTTGNTRGFNVLRILDWTNFLLISACAILTLSAYGDIFTKNKFDEMRRDSPIYFFDFCKYYICGKLASSEDRLRVYDEAVQRRYLEEVAGAARDKPVEYIQYPPIDFPLMMPLAEFPPSKAFSIFFLGSFFLALLSTDALAAQISAQRIKRLSFLWLALAASLPLFRAFSLGQTSLFSLAMAATYFAALLGGSQILGGLALALTAIKPQYTIYFATAALARRRYALLAAALVAEIVLIGLATQTIGIDNVINYPHIVLRADQSENLGGVFASQMVNLRAVLCAFMNERTAMKASSVCTLSALILLFILWRKENLDTRKLIVLTVILCLATSPHTHLYDCLLLALPALIAVPFSLVDISKEKNRAMRFLNTLLFFYPLLGWALIYWPTGAEARATLPFAVLNLILAILALKALFISKAEKAPQAAAAQ